MEGLFNLTSPLTARTKKNHKHWHSMSSSLRRYAAMSDEVEHLDSELTELLKEIRAAVEVCEHAAHGSFRPKQSRAAGAAVGIEGDPSRRGEGGRRHPPSLGCMPHAPVYICD